MASSPLSDEELLSRFRAGELSAYDELYARHAAAARAAAFRIDPTLDGDDVVSEAFLRILAVVQRGGGPTTTFRPYLYQTVRSIIFDLQRETTALPLDEEIAPPEMDETHDDAFDRSAVVRAFAQLPTQWQTILWYVEVEGLRPREIGPLLELKPNTVSQIARRARRQLGENWALAHVAWDSLPQDCRHALEGEFFAHRATRAAARHLSSCTRCHEILQEQRTIRRRLGRTLGIAVIGAGPLTPLLDSDHRAVASTALPVAWTAPALVNSSAGILAPASSLFGPLVATANVSLVVLATTLSALTLPLLPATGSPATGADGARAGVASTSGVRLIGVSGPESPRAGEDTATAAPSPSPSPATPAPRRSVAPQPSLAPAPSTPPVKPTEEPTAPSPTPAPSSAPAPSTPPVKPTEEPTAPSPSPSPSVPLVPPVGGDRETVEILPTSAPVVRPSTAP